jgi:hypothetical protein
MGYILSAFAWALQVCWARFGRAPSHRFTKLIYAIAIATIPFTLIQGFSAS